MIRCLLICMILQWSMSARTQVINLEIDTINYPKIPFMEGQRFRKFMHSTDQFHYALAIKENDLNHSARDIIREVSGKMDIASPIPRHYYIQKYDNNLKFIESKRVDLKKYDRRFHHADIMSFNGKIYALGSMTEHKKKYRGEKFFAFEIDLESLEILPDSKKSLGFFSFERYKNQPQFNYLIDTVNQRFVFYTVADLYDQDRTLVKFRVYDRDFELKKEKSLFNDLDDEEGYFWLRSGKVDLNGNYVFHAIGSKKHKDPDAPAGIRVVKQSYNPQTDWKKENKIKKKKRDRKDYLVQVNYGLTEHYKVAIDHLSEDDIYDLDFYPLDSNTLKVAGLCRPKGLSHTKGYFTATLNMKTEEVNDLKPNNFTQNFITRDWTGEEKFQSKKDLSERRKEPRIYGFKITQFTPMTSGNWLLNMEVNYNFQTTHTNTDRLGNHDNYKTHRYCSRDIISVMTTTDGTEKILHKMRKRHHVMSGMDNTLSHACLVLDSTAIYIYNDNQRNSDIGRTIYTPKDENGVVAYNIISEKDVVVKRTLYPLNPFEGMIYPGSLYQLSKTDYVLFRNTGLRQGFVKVKWVREAF